MADDSSDKYAFSWYVKLRTGTREFLVHRNILFDRSPVFAAMFDGDTIESRTGIVTVYDMEESTVESLIKYFYSKKLPEVDCGGALKLLSVAERYQIQSLEEQCCSFIRRAMSVENACEIISAVDSMGKESLKTLALNFIAENAELVLPTLNYSHLPDENPALVSEILSYVEDGRKEKLG